MNTTIVFVATVVFSFVVGRSLATWAARWMLPSGVGYLAAGVLLGPVVPFAVLSDDVLHTFDLLLSMVLGVLGFAVGLALRRKSRELETTLAGVLSSLGVAFGVTAIALAVLQYLSPAWSQGAKAWIAQPLMVFDNHLVWLWIIPEALWLSLTIGAVASVSSIALLWQLSKHRKLGESAVETLNNLCAASQLTAVLLFGVAMAGARTTGSSSDLSLTLTEWSMLSIFAGSVCGLLFGIFIGNDDDEVRINVAIVGAVTFASGVGAALGVSPLLVNLVAGLVVSGTSAQAERLEATIGQLRHPATVLVFLLAGAYWRPVEGWLWALPFGYAAIRFALRIFSTRVAVSIFLSESPVAVGVGGGMLTHGTIACAIAMGYVQRFPEHQALLLTTVLGGIVASDLLSLPRLRRYLADVGALDPVADDPVSPELTQKDELSASQSGSRLALDPLSMEEP